jgi:protein tyrosine phosphatase (PTP) superfamily phosphohydrolase (DUF442 family)
MLFRDHLHVVQPGRVYRAAQMSAERLQTVVAHYGIRTVVNLRGACPDFDWYREECRATARADISQEDVTFSAIRLPPPGEVRRLIEILDRTQYPILLHCRQGVDRTGLASAIVQLLDPHASLADAEWQLSLAFGYIPFNGTEAMREFLRLYRDWLRQNELAHSSQVFRYWATVEYCPGPRRGMLLSQCGESLTRPAHRGIAVPVRAVNTSIETWRLRRGLGWGVRVDYSLRDRRGNLVFRGRAGLFDTLVPPGESIELTLGLPPLDPGVYTLFADLIAADGNAFCQFGNDPLVVFVTVTP